MFITYVHRLLEELRAWVMSHDDAVKGEDLASEINKLRSEYKALADTPESSWIGCVGSSPQFGGYPCGLWSLFHTLTVNHAEEGHGNEDPKIVLKAMSGFVEHFFGCRDCARHFAQVY